MDVWYKSLILENGKLDDTKTTSEYERGFIDCWNEAIEAAALIVEPNPHKEEERECKDVAKAVRSLKIARKIL